MMGITKILHQIWCDKYNDLPDAFIELSDTWKNKHPDWKYLYWTEKDLYDFVDAYYPQYKSVFEEFPYDIQRWDAVRYLILEKIGGLYVDFDYECIDNVEPLLKKDCCFSKEPVEHVFLKEHEGIAFNNALIYAAPGNPFIKHIVENVFSEKTIKARGKDETMTVLLTTGPLMLTELYRKYDHKDRIYLIPAQYVSPLTYNDIQYVQDKQDDTLLLEKMQEAYAVHYYCGSWRNCKI